MTKLGQFENMPDDEYRKTDALANSDALLIARSPSDFVWSKTAPTDPNKINTTDIGKALHCALLEPERFDDLVFVSSFKGRNTKGFQDEQLNNHDKLVLTNDEAEQVRIMVASVMAHPTAKMLLEANGPCESSVFVKDSDTGMNLKCRPDKDLVNSMGLILDIKSTSSIEDWRSDREWINPLFKFNYGHQGSFYTDVCEQHYGKEIERFVFLVIQKTIELGRYPVAVISISRDELIEQGFWTQHRVNIDRYKTCIENNNWIHFESFNLPVPDDYGDIGEVEVTFDEVQS